MRPNPHGILPEGNALVAGSSKRSLSIRFRGAGSGFWCLNDETLLDILSFMDSKTLAAFSETSQFMHILCSQDYLWRDLTLFEFGSRSISFAETWKKTYYTKKLSHLGYDHLLSCKVNGLISGHLFRRWLCGTTNPTTDIPNFLKYNDIVHIDISDIPVETFVHDFEIANKPVVIKGIVDTWPALRKWTAEYLEQVCGDRLFRATSAAAGHAAVFTMRDYISYSQQVQEEAPLYLFERDFASVSQLAEDYEVPVFFNNKHLQQLRQENPSFRHYSDLFSILGEDKRPDYRWLVCGPAGSGSLFHIDPNQTHAWNVSIQGRKKWIFYPPHRPPPGVESSADGAEVIVPISTNEWLLTFWAFHLEARHDPDPKNRPLEVLAMPGEMVFVPHGWWHMVVNLDFCVALTHNFVSSSNLPDCLRFLRDQRDQVSGVRDRSNALQPEELYEEFVLRLRDHLPADQLEEAMTESFKPSSLQKLHDATNSVGHDKRGLNRLLSRSRRRRKGSNQTAATSTKKSVEKKSRQSPPAKSNQEEKNTEITPQPTFCFNFEV